MAFGSRSSYEYITVVDTDALGRRVRDDLQDWGCMMLAACSFYAIYMESLGLASFVTRAGLDVYLCVVAWFSRYYEEWDVPIVEFKPSYDELRLIFRNGFSSFGCLFACFEILRCCFGASHASAVLIRCGSSIVRKELTVASRSLFIGVTLIRPDCSKVCLVVEIASFYFGRWVPLLLLLGG